MTKPGDGCSRPSEAERGPDTFLENLDQHTASMQRGVRMALLIHKKLGHPVVVWEEGRGVVWIQPEDIPVDDSEFEGEPLVMPWW
jgi:hypothetical protein